MKKQQNPTFDTVRELSAIFNVSVDELAGYSKSGYLSLFGLHENQKFLLETLAEQFRKNNRPAKKMTEEQCALIGRIVEEFIK